MVHHPAGRSHDDVGAVFQACALTAQGHAAAQRDHFDVVLRTRQAADFGAYLVGQLTRGAEHQRLHGKPARIKFGKQGQGEGGSLAAAGLGLGDQVLASQRRRQAGRLDRRHLVVAQLGQVGQSGLCQGQGGEVGGRVSHARLSGVAFICR